MLCSIGIMRLNEQIRHYLTTRIESQQPLA